MHINSLADETHFRKDLIYRINTVEIIVPPLRNRGKDIILLAKHFIDLYSDKYLKSGFKLSDNFKKKLSNYHFPGNVRELQYALERAIIMTDDSILHEDDLVFSPIEKSTQKTRKGS